MTALRGPTNTSGNPKIRPGYSTISITIPDDLRDLIRREADGESLTSTIRRLLKIGLEAQWETREVVGDRVGS